MDYSNIKTIKRKKIVVDGNHCFLCGRKFNDKNIIKTNEDVFPKWLQKDFGITDDMLTLLNNSEIKYHHILVPCCSECNNHLMSAKLEKPIKSAVNNGYEDFIKIDPDIVFYWMLKISYGILYLETSLKRNRKNPKSRSIIPKKWLIEDFETNRLLLNSITKKTTFTGKPYSLLVFNVKNELPNKYWGFDLPHLDSHFMLINDIGIIISYSDNGLNERFFKSFEEFDSCFKNKLSLAQYFEICALYSYKKSLCISDPIIFFVENENTLHIICEQTPPSYKEFDSSEYINWFIYFEKFCNNNLSKKDVLINGKIATYLRKSDGSFYNML